MNQLDNSDERPFLTSQSVAPPPSSSISINLSSNEKNSLSNNQTSKLIKEENFNTSTSTTLNNSLSTKNIDSTFVPKNCLTNSASILAPNSLKAVHSEEESAKIVVSNESSNSHQSFKSELHSEPETSVSQTTSSLKRPLVAYEEDEQKGDNPPESASVPLDKPERSETKESQSEEKLFQTECPASDAATLVEEQQPSTSTSGAPTVDSSFSQSKPKTKRVRISIKLDSLSVSRLKRLAVENPKLLRRFGLKAYRINNLNGSNNKFQVIKLPHPRPQTQHQQVLSNKPGRRTSRATSSSSITPSNSGSGNISSPTRFRPPFPRVHSNFEFTKAGPSTFSMEQTRTQQQHYQYPSQFNQNQRPPSQPPQQAQVQQRYPSPVPQQQQRHMGQPEPGPSNVTDSPYLSGLLSNNSQQPQSQQPSSQPGTPIQQQPPQQPLRYPPPGPSQVPPQQQQQVQQQRMMNPPVYQQPPQQGGPPQMASHQQQHMMQHNPYQQQYPPQQRMHHMVPSGAQPMQQISGQQPMMAQGAIPQPPQQESPPKAKPKRNRTSKKQKEQQKAAEEQRKQQQQQQMQQQIGPGHIQHQGQPPDYYMMQQRIPMGQQPGMVPQPRMNYPQGYPQGYPAQQPSTSMMPNYPGGPPHGYAGQQQQQMWQQMNPHEYQMQMHQQMMRPQINQQQNPGTPTSLHYPAQSPGYPPNGPPAQQQKIRMQTPNYPQPSPQYTAAQQQQQQMNRQFMSPPNHPSPGYNQGQQTPNQFAYPQPQPPQMMQQSGPNQGGQQQPGMEEYNYGELNENFEGIGGLEGLDGEEYDLDSITPMNTDALGMQTPQQQQQHAQHPPPHQQQQGQVIQQQSGQEQYEPHQYTHQHIQQAQQQPMGPPPPGYHPSPSYQQQHFPRPQSPHYVQQMMHPQQIHQQQMKPLGAPDIFIDGDDNIKDEIPNSPSKCSAAQQKKIDDTLDCVLDRCRNSSSKDFIDQAWEDLKLQQDEKPGQTGKGKRGKSTNSRQPKHSQSSSNANTPTPGPIIAGNSSTGTEPSTPIKEEMMEFRNERKNSTLSNLLSGNSTPTIKSEENGMNEASCSGGIISPTVKSERDTTATPVSTVSTPIDMEPTIHHLQQQGSSGIEVKLENNNGNDNQYSRFNGHPTPHHDQSGVSMNEAVALKTTNNDAPTVVDSNDAQLMPPPCKIRKTDDVLDDNSAKYFEGDHISAATS